MLRTVDLDPHHASTRIGRPDRAVALRQDALGALEVMADRANRAAIYLPAIEWIVCRTSHGYPFQLFDNQRVEVPLVLFQHRNDSTLHNLLEMRCFAVCQQRRLILVLL